MRGRCCAFAKCLFSPRGACRRRLRSGSFDGCQEEGEGGEIARDEGASRAGWTLGPEKLRRSNMAVLVPPEIGV
jgi:hypothetical protein